MTATVVISSEVCLAFRWSMYGLGIANALLVTFLGLVMTYTKREQKLGVFRKFVFIAIYMASLIQTVYSFYVGFRCEFKWWVLNTLDDCVFLFTLCGYNLLLIQFWVALQPHGSQKDLRGTARQFVNQSAWFSLFAFYIVLLNTSFQLGLRKALRAGVSKAHLVTVQRLIWGTFGLSVMFVTFVIFSICMHGFGFGSHKFPINDELYWLIFRLLRHTPQIMAIFMVLAIETLVSLAKMDKVLALKNSVAATKIGAIDWLEQRGMVVGGPLRLKAILRNKLGPPFDTETFRQFLKQEHNEENLNFWLAVEKSKESEEAHKKMIAYKEIYQTHVWSGGKEIINIDSKLFEKLHVRHEELRVASGEPPLQDPNNMLFDPTGGPEIVSQRPPWAKKKSIIGGIGGMTGLKIFQNMNPVKSQGSSKFQLGSKGSNDPESPKGRIHVSPPASQLDLHGGQIVHDVSYRQTSPIQRKGIFSFDKQPHDPAGPALDKSNGGQITPVDFPRSGSARSDGTPTPNRGLHKLEKPAVKTKRFSALALVAPRNIPKSNSYKSGGHITPSQAPDIQGGEGLFDLGLQAERLTAILGEAGVPDDDDHDDDDEDDDEKDTLKKDLKLELPHKSEQGVPILQQSMTPFKARSILEQEATKLSLDEGMMTKPILQGDGPTKMLTDSGSESLPSVLSPSSQLQQPANSQVVSDESDMDDSGKTSVNLHSPNKTVSMPFPNPLPSPMSLLAGPESPTPQRSGSESQDSPKSPGTPKNQKRSSSGKETPKRRTLDGKAREGDERLPTVASELASTSPPAPPSRLASPSLASTSPPDPPSLRNSFHGIHFPLAISDAAILDINGVEHKVAHDLDNNGSSSNSAEGTPPTNLFTSLSNNNSNNNSSIDSEETSSTDSIHSSGRNNNNNQQGDNHSGANGTTTKAGLMSLFPKTPLTSLPVTMQNSHTYIKKEIEVVKDSAEKRVHK
eukprot:g80494.t1